MRATVVAACCGFGAVVGWRWLNPPPAPSPSVAAAPPLAAPAPARPPTRAPQTVGPLAPAPLAPAPLAPDLVAMDALLGHLYGEATPWPSEAERIEVTERLRAEVAGLQGIGGQVLAEDCESWPCIMLLELPVEDMDTAIEQVHAAVGSARSYAFIEQGPGVQRILIEQAVDDVSPWDPHLLLRKDDLLMVAALPPVDPAGAEAQRPLALELRAAEAP